MECPKCQEPMTTVEHQGIEVDRCTGCQGIWFDLGEADRLRDMKGSAAVDTGDAGVGKEMNIVDRIDCPRCHTAMIRMVDPQQTHIWYEECGSCHGSFFDAGEFADLATVSVSDVFKRFTTPERR